jgi:hypothetical protein
VKRKRPVVGYDRRRVIIGEALELDRPGPFVGTRGE